MKKGKHEWKNGRCVHCRKEYVYRAEPQPPCFTKQERAQILGAASGTWEYVASDAYQLEGFKGTIPEKAELVLDADRIVTIGGLDEELYERLGKLGWKEQIKFVRSALL
jgi:hypothetical protein